MSQVEHSRTSEEELENLHVSVIGKDVVVILSQTFGAAADNCRDMQDAADHIIIAQTDIASTSAT